MPLAWFRMYSADILGDKKIPRVAREVGLDKCSMLGFWSIMLCLANDSPIRGKLLVTLRKRYSIADVAEEVGYSETLTQKIIDILVDPYEMVHFEDGVICITNWGKRQYESDNSTERVRKFRQKQSESGDGNGNETLQKRSGNAPDTDTDTETESDTETEKDKNNNVVGVVFSSYESNIGQLTPVIAERLGALIDDYSEQWVTEAIQIAVENETRKLSYIHGILKNWKTNGKSARKKQKSGDFNDYIEDEYAEFYKS